MKFKKTKLTALAMSVLMAASTITSVTWAADLFTDGAPAEAVVEASVESGLNEDVEVADDMTLLSRSLTGVKIDSVSENTSKKMVIGFWPVYDDDEVNGLGAYQTAIGEETSDRRSANCEHGDEVVYRFEYAGEPFYTDYEPVIDGKGVQPHTYDFISVVDPKDAPGCLKVGHAYAYLGCTSCKKAKTSSGLGTNYLANKDVESLKDIWDDNPQIAGVATNSDGVQVKCIELDALEHSWGPSFYSTKLLDPADKLSDRIYSKEGEKDPYVNCEITGADRLTVTGPIDNDKDAYYYERQECSRCGAIKDLGTHYQYYANMKENEVNCVAGNNVEGFVYIDSNGFLKKWPGADNDIDTLDDNKIIPKDKFVAAILENCEKPGSYDIISYSKDEQGKIGHISTETKSVSKGHAFSNVLIGPDSKGNWSGYLLEELKPVDDDHKYVADYDENKNVVKAYSNDCKEKAKYTLYHYCFSSQCGLKETIGAEKITDLGTVHAFETWEVDNSKTVYTKIDEKTHKEHYIETSKCVKCGVTGERDSVSKPDAVKEHTLASAEVKDTRVEPTCGENGSYKRGYTCACGYVDEDSITTVTIPATDKHDFGTNEAFIQWSGEVYIANSVVPKRSMIPYVGRKCNICGKIDANGINDTKVGTVEALQIVQNVVENDTMFGVVAGSVVDAKKDPATNVTYPCSTAHATLFVDWLGTVDGKVVKLNSSNTTNAVLENVPYYASLEEYEGRTAHNPGSVKIEKRVEPTTEKDGSYDEVVYCTVCGDEVSRNTVTIPKDIQVSVPTVTATAVNYNTVNVSWTPVEGATSYRLYYRSADLGITTWHRVRTLKGTSFTHSGLTTGARYRYTVRAEVNGKLGDYSRTGSVARPLPAAPEMKSVTAVSNGTRVTWSKVDGADGYIIFRKTTGAFTRVGAVSKGSKVTWTDRKPVSGATYKVRAYRTVNNVNYKGAFSAAK